MAEDRMLSDEILLGLIKSNGGGGGGGTTNYNDLSNQPQINGNTLVGNKTASDLGLATETELADKADKSAIKNEFLGTLEEWNALTVEQRKAYDTYQIKCDYTEGSVGLPDYSTTEQKTGRKWIDGKDIYFRTFDFGRDVAFTNDWINMSAYVSISGWDKPIGGAWGVNSTGVCINVNTAINAGYLEIKAGFNGEMRYLTLYYTKTA